MKRRIKVLRDLPEIKLVGRQLGPFAEGSEPELEVWEAAILEKHGLVEPTQRVTPTELKKLILTEERESGLAKLPLDFYSTISQKISSLIAAGKQEEAEEMRSQATTLMEIRLLKLVQVALSPESGADLPPQERFLINRLASVIDLWSEWVNKSLWKADQEVGGNEELGTV